MTKLQWDGAGQRFYESGVDRGVLYVSPTVAVPWNGLLSVDESTSGGDPRPYYQDGVKYLSVSGREQFAATIEAYTYPDEFAPHNGWGIVKNGLRVGNQRRITFNLTYRTGIGNDTEGLEHGYKIHLVYNALVTPSNRAYRSSGQSADPTTFSWELSTTPTAVAGFKPTAHLVLDSRFAPASLLKKVEDILYGSDNLQPRMPTALEIITLVDEFVEFEMQIFVDGTYTAVGDGVTYSENSPTFKIEHPSVSFGADGTFTVL